MIQYQHEYRDKVRDYECDLQGIVNNANYQHYIEHARHEFILTKGLSFRALHDKGVDCVVARITMQYKVPLKSLDEYVVRSRVEKEGIRYVFYQDIYRGADDQLCFKAKVEVVCVIDGKLGDTDELKQVFE